MAKLREIRKRIKSVKNTKKITKTMEMVATAKFKRAMDRVKSAQPYAEEVTGLLRACAAAARERAEAHPLVRAGAEGAPEALLAFTANRGLCGGFNTNVIKRTKAALHERAGAVLSVIGKKGIGVFRFEGVAVDRKYTHFGDRPSFAEAKALAAEFAGDFAAGRLRSLSLVYTQFRSAGEQKPAVVQVLPIPLAAFAQAKGAGRPERGLPPLTSPGPDGLLERLVPLWLELQFYRALVESAACEQVSRRIAMKAATDNAQEMIKSLTGDANRARQSQITQEIAEIVGGAEAIQ